MCMGIGNWIWAPIKVGSLICALLMASLGVAHADRESDLIVPKGVNVSALLIARDGSSGGHMIELLDVDVEGRPVFVDGALLRVLGSTDIMAFLDVPKVDAFSWMRNGSSLFIVGARLASFDGRRMTSSIGLPHMGMRVRAAGQHTAYIFGGDQPRGNHTVYLVARDGSVAKIVTLPVAVSDVTGDGLITYIAAGNRVLKIAPGPSVSVALQLHEDILSISNTSSGGIFYSTRSVVGYLGASGASFSFMQTPADVLRVQGSALYVFVREGPHLLRVDPVDSFGEVAAKMTQTEAK